VRSSTYFLSSQQGHSTNRLEFSSWKPKPLHNDTVMANILPIISFNSKRGNLWTQLLL